MQYFLVKINFLRKFISDYVQIIIPIQDMIKKDTLYNWGKKEKDGFSCVKQEIVEIPALYNPYFNKKKKSLHFCFRLFTHCNVHTEG